MACTTDLLRIFQNEMDRYILKQTTLAVLEAPQNLGRPRTCSWPSPCGRSVSVYQGPWPNRFRYGSGTKENKCGVCQPTVQARHPGFLRRSFSLMKKS